MAMTTAPSCKTTLFVSAGVVAFVGAHCHRTSPLACHHHHHPPPLLPSSQPDLSSLCLLTLLLSLCLFVLCTLSFFFVVLMCLGDLCVLLFVHEQTPCSRRKRRRLFVVSFLL
eukprot:m.79399 g.79399  ORF g.79399 m.79399 type:complete len:113 (+) comp8181_c0_seq4:2790-3128(+)